MQLVIRVHHALANRGWSPPRHMWENLGAPFGVLYRVT
jgi:hypothetical protein